MIRSLQSLRFVFIYLVVISHFVNRTFDFGGECGVSFFFMLSGFVLSLANAGRIGQGTYSTRGLFMRQLFKVYPLHILTMAIMLVMEWRLGNDYSPMVLLTNVLLVQSWVPSDDFYFVANGSSWFLCDILFFYLLFRILYSCIMTMKRKEMIISVSAVAVVYILIMCVVPEQLVNPILYANPMMRILDFCIGILIYRLYRSSRVHTVRDALALMPSWRKTMIEVMLVISVCMLAFVYPELPHRIRTASCFWFVLPMVILYFALADNRGGMITQILHDKRLLWAGNISFEIYLIHIPVVRITDSIVAHTGFLADSDIANFFAYSIVLLLLSMITRRCFVNPLSNRMNVWYDKRKTK